MAFGHTSYQKVTELLKQIQNIALLGYLVILI